MQLCDLVPDIYKYRKNYRKKHWDIESHIPPESCQMLHLDPFVCKFYLLIYTLHLGSVLAWATSEVFCVWALFLAHLSTAMMILIPSLSSDFLWIYLVIAGPSANPSHYCHSCLVSRLHYFETSWVLNWASIIDYFSQSVQEIPEGFGGRNSVLWF